MGVELFMEQKMGDRVEGASYVKKDPLACMYVVESAEWVGPRVVSPKRLIILNISNVPRTTSPAVTG